MLAVVIRPWRRARARAGITSARPRAVSAWARLCAVMAPALLAGALAGCGGAAPGAQQAPGAAQPTPAAEPGTPAAPAAAEDPAAAETAGTSEDPAAAEAATAAEEPEPAAKPAAVTDLRGRFGFDWLHPESTRCRALDKAFVARLEKAGATCQERAPGESFGVDVGPWHSCAAGDQEWMIFATKKICTEMFETMMAHAP